MYKTRFELMHTTAHLHHLNPMTVGQTQMKKFVHFIISKAKKIGMFPKMRTQCKTYALLAVQQEEYRGWGGAGGGPGEGQVGAE